MFDIFVILLFALAIFECYYTWTLTKSVDELTDMLEVITDEIDSLKEKECSWFLDEEDEEEN